jgi:hypothetical protein
VGQSSRAPTAQLPQDAEGQHTNVSFIIRAGKDLWSAREKQVAPNEGMEPDCLQRPLRSRFRQRLMPGVGRPLSEA